MTENIRLARELIEIAKTLVAGNDEMLNAFEENCPRIFNSKSRMQSGNKFSFQPAYCVSGESFYGSIEVWFKNGVITMEAELGPDGYPYPNNDCKLVEKATVRSENDVVDILKEFRKKQQKEFKEYLRQY